MPAPANDAGSTLAAAAGAAATDTRKLDLVSVGPLDRTAPLSVTRRVLSSGSTQARRVMADLAETPYRFNEGAQGVAATQGGALDRIAKTNIIGTRVQVSDEMQRLFAEYRFGENPPSFPRARATLDSLTGGGEGKLTYSEFKSAVTDALRNGDRHDVPQVAQAAQFIRQKALDPWKGRAQGAGLLPDDVTTRTAETYAPRQWNKEAIGANRPRFVDTVQGWLSSDQATKASTKARLAALSDELNAAETALAKAKNAESAVAATARRDAVRTRIEAEIAAWDGKSVSEAKSAIKAREKYAATATTRDANAPPLESANAAIDRAVKRILASERDLSPDELRAKAHEITDRILSSPDGRLPYDIASGGPEIGFRGGSGEPPRGSLAARDFAIPDAAVKDFLENDAEHLVGNYLRTVVPDVLLTEKFGDTRMTAAFRAINDEYAALIDKAGSEAARVRLEKERLGVIRDIAAVRDRVRSVYGWSGDLRNAARVANGAKAINNLAAGGSFAIASIPDMAGAVFRNGFGTTFRDGWVPFVKHLFGTSEGWAKAKAQLRALGIGTETTIAARQHAIDDVMATYKPNTPFERGLQYASDKSFLVNLLTPWTDWAKTVTANVSSAEILRAVEAVAKGKATKRQIASLAENGIDAPMAGRIWSQFDPSGAVKAGEVVDGVHLPNTADWRDLGARQAFESAVGREVEIAVVTPGQEKPLWMSQPVISLIGQFKSFVAASNERILIANLQRRDAQALSGLIFAIGLGMVSYRLNAFFAGTPVSDRPQDWIKESISRGGLLGWLEEGNAMASKMTRGTVDIYRSIGADKPLSRYASRSVLDQLLGPTAGKVEGIAKITGAAAARDWNETDTRAVRRLVAFQNLFYARRLFDKAETGLNDAFGIDMKAKP